MKNQNDLSPDTLSDVVTHQINSLLKKYPRFTSSISMQELGDHIVHHLTDSFTDTYVEFAYTDGTNTGWKIIPNSATAPDHTFKQQITEPAPGSSFVHEEAKILKLIHTLDDSSKISILLVRHDSGPDFTKAELMAVRIFAYIVETACRNIIHHKKEKDLIFSLNHRILQLNSLIETGIEVEKLDHHASPHHLAIIRAASLTNASCATVRVTSGSELKEEYYFPEFATFDPTTCTNMISSGFTFRDDTYTFTLYDKESRRGNVPFEETDQLLLDALAKQVYASLENRYLHQQTLEKQRIEQEMAVAATIQKRIIPVSLPAIKGYDIAGINIPSKSVGGDYFDCLPLPDGRYILIIADVAGKGIPAALLVSTLHAYLSAYLEGDFTLPSLASRLNSVLHKASTDDKFVTAFFILLTPRSGKIEYINAGHNPVYVCTANKRIRELKADGLPLGMFPGIEYPSSKFKLNHNEKIFLYTDGVTEAQDEAGGYFEDFSAVDKYFLKHRHLPAQDFISRLIQDIKSFTGSAQQNDDITALCLWRL